MFKKIMGEELIDACKFAMQNQFVSKYSKTSLVKNSFAYESELFFHKTNDQFLDLYLKNYKVNNYEPNYNLSISSFFSEGAKNVEKYRSLAEVRNEKTISLEKDIKLINRKSISKLVEIRKSNRDFSITKKLSLDELSGLLKYSYGIFKNGHRAYASAGALYPIKIYLYCNNIINLASGYYEYYPYSHSLKLINNEQLSNPNDMANLININFENYSCLVFYVYESQINRYKYSDEALIFAGIEVGEMMQNVQLLCANNNWSICDLGGYESQKILDALKLKPYFGNYLVNVSIVGGAYCG